MSYKVAVIHSFSTGHRASPSGCSKHLAQALELHAKIPKIEPHLEPTQAGPGCQGLASSSHDKILQRNPAASDMEFDTQSSWPL